MTDAERSHIPPSVNAAYVLDLKPLLAWFRDEQQRLRDQLAVERTAASSAREALAAAEERARVEREGRIQALGEANRCAVERDNALAELERAKRDVERAAMSSPMLVPGSVAALKEAVRLLCGHEPRVQPKNSTTQAYWCTPCEDELPAWLKARLALLTVLEALQPAASVEP